jgi:tetratricopeptide (TPR) repeat protein
MAKLVEKKVEKQPKVAKEDVLIDVAEVTHDAQNWFETNKKLLLGAAIALVAIIGGSILWKNNVASNQKKAVAAMWKAEQLFERDSFATAISSADLNLPGFQQILSKYGSTPAGNASNLYSAISYMQLGKFDDAIKYLDAFSPSGEIAPTLKAGLLADAYSEKKDFAKALKLYKEAANAGSIEDLKALYLKRFGQLSEMQNDAGSALEAYNEIKSKYPLTNDARDIDKFIARAEAKKK